MQDFEIEREIKARITRLYSMVGDPQYVRMISDAASWAAATSGQTVITMLDRAIGKVAAGATVIEVRNELFRSGN